ncbi:MAG: hypothetical protein NWR72_04965, partial [Bacteroidia bacterium]|nr:hypothetical protein [Bacteroidia bacterium]
PSCMGRSQVSLEESGVRNEKSDKNMASIFLFLLPLGKGWDEGIRGVRGQRRGGRQEGKGFAFSNFCLRQVMVRDSGIGKNKAG